MFIYVVIIYTVPRLNHRDCRKWPFREVTVNVCVCDILERKIYKYLHKPCFSLVCKISDFRFNLTLFLEILF